jgi:hypothetical protein
MIFSTELPKLGDKQSTPNRIRLHNTEWEQLAEIAAEMGLKKNQLIRRILVNAIAAAKAEQHKELQQKDQTSALVGVNSSEMQLCPAMGFTDESALKNHPR